MKSLISIRTWTEGFSEPKGVAVAFDIFRCCTTIHCLFNRLANPLLVAPSLKEIIAEPRIREYRIFSELSQPAVCHQRFDNSPFHALNHHPDQAPSLVATTTGTPSMFAARGFEKVYVGSLVNFSALVRTLAAYRGPITLVPAALPGSTQIEDEIVAQAVATALEGFANIPDFVKQCGAQAKEKILASPRPEVLAGKLPTGREDVQIALDVDRFDQALALAFEPGAPFARVEKL
jgi:phosphosulfolactate phosphohydrolase-like enzyme